jgi:hypothetical protein
MKYLNQFYKESAERKMKNIAYWRESPIDLKQALVNQRERKRLIKEMQNQG